MLCIFENYYKQFIDLLKRDAKYLKSKVNSDQVKAGIGKVNELGLITILDPMAKGDLLKYDVILAQPYENVFNKLVYDNRVAEFQKKYSEVLQNNSKVK